MGEEEEESRNQGSENGQMQMKEKAEEEVVLQLLDSTDCYLSLIHSLSSTLRQGWLELASARYSMGSSRVTSALFDLKLHSAATTLQVTQLDNESLSRSIDPMEAEPHFALSKWVSSYDAKGSPREADISEEQNNSNGLTLRRRGASQASDDKESPENNGSPVTVDDQVEKVRSKSLSVFGTLVSPKLRTSQHSFEKALETLVEIANKRSLILSAYAQLQNDMDTTT